MRANKFTATTRDCRVSAHLSHFVPRFLCAFVCFSPRSNGHLLNHYGFTLAHNPTPDSVVSLQLPPIEATLDSDARAEAESIRAQKLRLLRMLYPNDEFNSGSVWANSIDLHATGVSGPEAQKRSTKGNSSADAFDVYRCRFTSAFTAPHFSPCLSFARMAVATPAELLSLFTTQLPSCPQVKFTQPPISLANEARAAQFVAAAAARQLERYDSHMSGSAAGVDDQSRLQRHTAAEKAGLCVSNEQKASSPDCLTPLQQSYLHVRSSEKAFLRSLSDLASAVAILSSDPPHSADTADRWLTRKLPSEAQQLPAYQYLKLTLLPLHMQQQQAAN